MRTPSRVDRDLDLTGFLKPDPLIFVRLLGNPQFEAERLVAYELGYRSLLFPSTFLDVSVFRNQYSGLETLGAPSVISEDSPGPPHLVIVFPYANAIGGWTTGGEISATWTPNELWRIDFGYSHLHVNLSVPSGAADVGTAASDEGSSPSRQSFVMSRFTFRRGLELDQTLRYVAALPAQKVAAYATADLRASWRLLDNIEAAIAGRDLLQPSHAEFGGDPGGVVRIKRSVYPSLTWRR